MFLRNIQCAVIWAWSLAINIHWNQKPLFIRIVSSILLPPWSKIPQSRFTLGETLTCCNRTIMLISSYLNIFQTASFSPENVFLLCLEGKLKYTKSFAFSKDAFRTGILIIQINDNGFLHQPVHLPMPDIYWCISPSKQGWVEIYILINIFHMSMLWLKLNSNREICINLSKLRCNCSTVIRNGF